MSILHQHFDFLKTKSAIILMTFLSIIALARISVYFVENKFATFIFKYNIVEFVHIHHFVYGIFFLALSGFLSTIFPHRINKNFIAILYGIGLGLVVDEFGVWLKLDPTYHQEASLSAIFIVTIALFLSSFFEFRNTREKKVKS